MSITGSCLCGNVTFAYSGDMADAAYCHCTDCRKTTGSAFNISIGLAADGFEITKGTPKTYTKTADSGQAITRHFCADCGAPLYTSSPAYPERIYIKAGALDDPGVVKPTYQSYTRSRVTWSKIDDDLPGFETDRAEGL
ncbi:MAG: GFA family protein [Rhodospirillales bacterium]|nr:GFA family protein [Rhodospirillales bacterium]MBO6786141.1 GFA family protein [Rhodospirillales bacterium]